MQVSDERLLLLPEEDLGGLCLGNVMSYCMEGGSSEAATKT